MKTISNQVNDIIREVYLTPGKSYQDILARIKEVFPDFSISKHAITERVRVMKKKGLIPNEMSMAPIVPSYVAQTAPPAPEMGGRQVGLGAEQIRAKHNNRFKVRQAAAKLERGVFLTRQEFIQMSNIKQGSGYVQSLEAEEFKPFRGRADGSEYWGHPDSIRELINDGTLKEF